MKKAIILSLFVIPVLFACKKSSSGTSSSYHLTASVDGSSKSFNTSVSAIKIVNAGTTAIEVMGILNATTGESFAITITNAPGFKTIAAGTYTDANADFSLASEYNTTITTSFIASTGMSQSAASAGKTIHPLTLVITSIDATAIKGTFTGDFFLNGDFTGTPKKITSGDFYAKF